MFKCKSKWFTATSDAVSERDCLSHPACQGGQWEMGCSGFPSPAGARTRQPEGLRSEPVAAEGGGIS